MDGFGQATETHPPLSFEHYLNSVFTTFNVTADSSSTVTLSALEQKVNNVFASSPPLISNGAAEERETESVPVVHVHDENDGLAVELSLMVSF